MNLPKHCLAVLLAALIVSFSQAGEIAVGQPITAEDLAKQMGIYNASLVYKSDKPFTKLSVGLFYKERDGDGQFVDKGYVLYTTYALDKPTTEQTIKVLSGANASTIIVGNNTSLGKGVEISGPASSAMPPRLSKDGRYALITVYRDSKGNSESDIKAILELVVEAGD